MRVGLYLLVEVIWFTIFQAKNVKWRKAVEKSVLDRTLELIPTKYHKLMTPDYPYGCKRRVFDSDWLTSMHKPNFQLTERRVLAVDGRDLILGPHHVLNDDDDSMNDSLERINADIIILANGFDATHFLHPIKVRGRYGILLHELWKERGAASAYMGTAVHGFPNFFMVTGPNTSNGHNSIILTSENMVNYIIKIIKLILKGNATVAEIKAEPEAKWSEEVQRDLKGTVFGDCTSWYLDEKGHHSVTYL